MAHLDIHPAIVIGPYVDISYIDRTVFFDGYYQDRPFLTRTTKKALMYDPARTRWVLTQDRALRITVIIPGVDQ